MNIGRAIQIPIIPRVPVGPYQMCPTSLYFVSL